MLTLQGIFGDLRHAATQTFSPVWKAFDAFLYPPHCFQCGTWIGEAWEGLCESCWEDLDLIEGLRYARCGCPSSKPVPLCSNCVDKRFSFGSLRSLCRFNDNVQSLVHMLKYGGKTSIGTVLGRALGRSLEAWGGLNQGPVIVPVPLHAARQRERGYNQSLILSEGVSDSTKSMLIKSL